MNDLIWKVETGTSGQLVSSRLFLTEEEARAAYDRITEGFKNIAQVRDIWGWRSKKMNHIDTKIKIVEAGNSKIFKNWHEWAGINQDDFIEGLKWLCEDPGDDQNRLTRELGCQRGRGLVKIRRINDPLTTFYEIESGQLWATCSPNCASISARDRV